MFSLNSIGCATKCGPAGILEEIQPTDVWAITCSNLHTERSVIFYPIRWRATHGATKWIKNNLLMIPSVDLIRVKNMLNSTISMSYPDAVIACIEHKVSLEEFRAIEAALWSTIIIQRLFPGGWLITITANHSNYLVHRANTQSVRKG